ncbi:Thioredoxin domain-containing protein (Membrane protein 23) (mp23) [Durusdinium trenchii]|uniref:Thioredoxin domain-containing protein (Membrane protein 23) (Mp23) n=1 Tax=Durusdinium trenchii TaxID=1381693 RepID=A0ABP0I6I6_9DINO
MPKGGLKVNPTSASTLRIAEAMGWNIHGSSGFLSGAVPSDGTVDGGSVARIPVAFYAPWCGHCKRLVPVWEQLAQKLRGQIAVAKVDATSEEGLANEFDVTGFPTLVLVASGKRYGYRGARNVEALADFALGGFMDPKAKGSSEGGDPRPTAMG